MSISRPALQQLPREALVRSAFIPRDGNRLLTIDFDQIEARLLTHFSRDGGLLAAFEAGGDFFTNMARLIYHDESITKADPRRQLTKSATYAKAYGAGASKFAETAGISEAEGISFIAQYDDTFRGVKRLQREIDAVAIHRYATEGLAYVTSPLGRRHPVDHRETYKLTNYLLQGTAADIFKQKLVELDRAGLTDHLILPVHDEVIFDVPINEIDEVSAAALEVLEDHTSFIVPLTAGAEQLERWGDKYA
jgi:DNA polymerase-1